MINIFAYRPTIVIARVTRSFVDCGINEINTARIVKVADPFLEFNPNADFNAITGFEKDEAYFYFAVQNMDLEGIAENSIPDNVEVTPGINVFAGKYWAGIALQTISFAAAGIDSSNHSVIYKIGDPYYSYVPSESFSAIDGFEIGEPYFGLALADMDLSPYIIPPIVVSTELEQEVDPYHYYGTKDTDERDYYELPVRMYDEEADFPATGEEYIIYVDKTANKTFRWNGSAYVQIGGGSSYTSGDTLIDIDEVNHVITIDTGELEEQVHNGVHTYGGHKRLKTFFTDEGNVSSTDTNLCAYTIDANTLKANGDQIKLCYYLQPVSNGNAKTVNAYFGAYSLSFTLLGTTTSARLEMIITRDSSTSFRVVHIVTRDLTLNNHGFANSGVVDFTTTFLTRLVCNTPNNNALVVKLATIDYIPNN